MAYFITPNVTADNSAFPLRQAEGKVLGRVRSLVKGSTPRAGVKDYRFFVDPLSSLPPEMGEGPRFGFTGFMSRSGYGFNAFAGEEEALARLQEDLGGSFVTFTPALRNNKFFVLDDLKKEGRTPFMEQDEDYRPVPAFGRQGEPAMEGDINKFCRHLLEGKPMPGLSKKYWNNDFTPYFIAAAAERHDGKLGDFVLFAPLDGDAFEETVIDEGGAYFHGGRLGYKVIDISDEIMAGHVLRCTNSPLWFVPFEYIEHLKEGMEEVPADGDILSARGIEERPEVSFASAAEAPAGLGSILPSLLEKDTSESVTAGEEGQAIDEKVEEIEMSEETEEKPDREDEFLNRFSALASSKGLLYAEKDLINFHISVKSSRLTILSGMSGTGKSRLVRLYGEALGLPDDRIAVVPVRPSWMDDGDILGYADMKNMIYRPADTGLAELLLDAERHPEEMYIVCFDEMNLARAEHYFAQFISVLEKEEDPVIRLYNPSLQGRLYNGDSYPAEISIGRNVIFTGTVNVDESTYRFSDKILDRANMITLHQERFSDWLTAEKAEPPDLKEISFAQFESYRKTGDMELTARELEFLDTLNDALREGGVQGCIGFRVARQMDRYLKNIPENDGFDREAGLDCQLVQRILTKIRGSAQQLSALLSLSDKGEVEGRLVKVLDSFSDLSDFEESRCALRAKAQELNLYDYTV